MRITSRYWKFQVIDSPIVQKNKLKGGYKVKNITQAQEFFKVNFPKLVNQTTLSSEENKHIQTVLWKMFHSAEDIQQRALAGFCLRCYISQTILVVCKKIAHTYKSEADELLFTYIDLLPFVLNDDGKTLVILDSKGQNKQILNNDGTIQTIAKEGEFFTVEILRTFNPKLNSSESLDNWTWRLTQQNQNLSLFLWELGIRTPSAWGLLCREIPRSLQPRLQEGDFTIVEVFHAVYRRDRRNTNAKRRCCEPTNNQLQEMLLLLQQKNIIFNSYRELIYHLQRIAEILRQDQLYQKTGMLKTIPTEVYDQSINDYVYNPELPYHTDPEPEEIELQQLQGVCNELFENILYQAIGEVISEHLEYLKKSKGYKDFAPQLYQGLQLYYQDNLSLGEIAQLWEIPWSKTRRIFKLENLIDNVQYRTEDKFIEEISQVSTTSSSGHKLKTISSDPDYLKTVAEEIRNYALTLTFLEARAEIQSGKKKNKNSLFARLLCRYINHSINNIG
jgi:hypothetical protein